MNYPPEDEYNRRKREYYNDMYRSPADDAMEEMARKLIQPGGIYFTELSKAEPRRAEPSRPQLRGCGHPDCTICNNDIANRRARDGLTGTPLPGGTPPPAAWDPEEADSFDAVEQHLISCTDQAFADIIGNDDALASLRDAIEAPVKYAELYKAYGMKMPKGALLSGPPGCGKTMFARAAASEMKRLYGMEQFISISGGELQSMYVGATEAKIKAIFAYAREYAHVKGHPLLVFIDEADVLFPDRTGRVRRLAPWEESQVATFLAEMDGMQECGAFVLLATNRPEVMDQALLRDGRCDFKVTVKRPTQDAVEHIVRNSFASALMADPIEDLVFAATESFFDPHKVIADIHRMVGDIKEWFTSRGAKLDDEGERKVREMGSHNFCLEHIVSGAMAASVARRATLKAFARDKASGTASGIIVADVIAAVNDLFEENKTLEHQFAALEFLDDLWERVNAA
jgi:SpoVK/Ycf46/Vps4 family AAA+-type ATPase